MRKNFLIRLFTLCCSSLFITINLHSSPKKKITDLSHSSLVKKIDLNNIPEVHSFLDSLFINTNIDSIQHHISHIITWSLKPNHIDYRMSIYTRYAYKHYKLANYNLSNIYYDQIHQLYSTITENAKEFNYYQNIYIRSLIDQSKLYRSINNLERAKKNLYKAKELCDYRNYKKGLYMVHTNLYQLYMRLDEYEYAYQSIMKTLNYIPDTNEVYMSNFYTNLAFYYQKTTDYVKMDSCLQLSHYLGETSQMKAKVNTVYAYAESEKGNYTKAISYFELANNYYNSAGIEKNINKNLKEIASCYTLLGKDETASDIYIKLLSKYDSTQLHHRVPIIKSLINLHANDLEQLSKYQSLLIQSINKQLALDNKNAKEVLKAELRFNENMLRLKDQEALLLRMKRNALVISLLIVILFIIIMYRYKYTKLKLLIAKQNAEHKLAVKANQLNSKLVLLAKRNEELNRILELLGEVIKNTKGVDLSNLKKEIQLIKVNDDWINFIHSIDEIEYDFINIIKQNGINLSKSETRMLILTHNGYNAKEIGNMLNLAPKSVDMARYRLRKKMKLKKGTTIQEYIYSIS